MTSHSSTIPVSNATTNYKPVDIISLFNICIEKVPYHYHNPRESFTRPSTHASIPSPSRQRAQTRRNTPSQATSAWLLPRLVEAARSGMGARILVSWCCPLPARGHVHLHVYVVYVCMCICVDAWSESGLKNWNEMEGAATRRERGGGPKMGRELTYRQTRWHCAGLKTGTR